MDTGIQLRKVPGDSEHNVRCCNSNGDTCYTEVQNKKLTYIEASELCSKRGRRLTFKRELNGCCGTDCPFDNTTYWVTPGT